MHFIHLLFYFNSKYLYFDQLVSIKNNIYKKDLTNTNSIEIKKKNCFKEKKR